MSQQVLTSTYLHGIVDRYADLAQLAERIHGKDEVAGSIPAISIKWTRKPFIYKGFCYTCPKSAPNFSKIFLTLSLFFSFNASS